MSKAHELLTKFMDSQIVEKASCGSYIIRVPEDIYEEAKELIANTDDDGKKSFVLYWLSGKHEVVRGATIEDAFNSQYSAGAMAALDFYEESAVPNYNWDKAAKNWIKKAP